MSFSYTVKEELCSLITDRDKKYACLYGMLLFCKQFDKNGITLQTEHDKVSELFSEMISDVLQKHNSVCISEKKKRNNTNIYTLTVNSLDDCANLLSAYRIGAFENIHRINLKIIDGISLDAFLAGAFLAGGSMTDPNKEYHLEFVTPFYNLCNDLNKILSDIGAVKLTNRSGVHILYFKGSESIEDMLTFMGATMSSLEIMNIKILKDVRNKANRIANCDSANIEKTVVASSKQIDDINLIENVRGLGSLSDELREIAEIRLENPELSLRELGQMLFKPLGRSGANHRMMRISAIAEEIRLELPDLKKRKGAGNE